MTENCYKNKKFSIKKYFILLFNYVNLFYPRILHFPKWQKSTFNSMESEKIPCKDTPFIHPFYQPLIIFFLLFSNTFSSLALSRSYIHLPHTHLYIYTHTHIHSLSNSFRLSFISFSGITNLVVTHGCGVRRLFRCERSVKRRGLG